MQVHITVNGIDRGGDVEPRRLLVHYLREDLYGTVDYRKQLAEIYVRRALEDLLA